jgi:hypothetical protein
MKKNGAVPSVKMPFTGSNNPIDVEGQRQLAGIHGQLLRQCGTGS